MVERTRRGSSPRTIQNGNGAPQLPIVGGGLPGQNQNQRPGPEPDTYFPQVGVLSFEQARQQQQQKHQDDSWAQPPPHPGDRRALTPIIERPTRDSISLDIGTNPPPLQLSVVNGSPLQSSPIQKQPSETSQELPKLQTDAEPPTLLGEPLVMSPTSHIPLDELGIGRTDSAGSLGSKQEPASLSRPDSKLDTLPSTDAIRSVGGSISSPLSSPGKESVFSALPSPYSNQPIHPIQSTFSDIPRTPPRSPDRPTFTPPLRNGLGAENGSGSPTPSLSSRFQGAIQRREANSPSNSFTATTKTKTPEPAPPPQTDPHPNSPEFSPTPTTLNSPPTLTHTATTTSSTSKSEYSAYSGGVGPNPPQQKLGAFPSPNHSNSASYTNSYSYSTSQPQRTMQSESLQKESLSSSVSEKFEGTKPITQIGGGEKERSEGDPDLIKEAGALFYVREIQDASVVPPPKIVGRGQNIPVRSKGRSSSDDEEEPSTEDEPRPLPQQTQTQPHPQRRLPPEPSPLRVRRPSAQAKMTLVEPPPPPPLASPPQHSIQPSPSPAQSKYRDHPHAQGPDQQPVLVPQPQQPITSTFNPINAIEGDVRSTNLPSPDSDTNPTSPVVDSRRISVVGHGSGGGQGGSRPGLVSRPSGARDLVSKQRGGGSDPTSSQFRHNGQPQPRHTLPPHPESFYEQPPQFDSYPTRAQPPHYQGKIFAWTWGDTAQLTSPDIGTANRHPANMANIDHRQRYDDNSDALAALTFLEHGEANGASKPPPQESRGPMSEADEYGAPPVRITSSDSRDDVSQDSDSHEGKYKSSFAPSRQATQRLAKSQAQQAAHQAAAHRPGKSGGANGKGKKKASRGGWAESSDEEEEEEDEDDEDVDSDGDPVASGRSQGHGTGPGQNFGKLSAQGSPYGSNTDLNQHQLGQGRPQRHLPRPPSPGRGYGTYFLHDAVVLYHQFNPDLVSCRRSRRLLSSTRTWRTWTIY
jgi:CCR4-NOT transcriptional complex subunit CAF120